MPRKPEPSFELKLIIWDVAVRVGKNKLEAIQKQVDYEIDKRRKAKPETEDVEIFEDTPDTRTIKRIINDDINMIAQEVLVSRVPQHLWLLRTDYEQIKQLRGEQPTKSEQNLKLHDKELEHSRSHDTRDQVKLNDTSEPKPLRVLRYKKNIPEYMVRFTTGKELINLVLSSYAYSMENDELITQKEVDMVGELFQNLKDWGDVGDELEPSDRVKIGFELTRVLDELEQEGFSVFGAREVRMLEGGVPPEPSQFPVTYIRVVRKDNPDIIDANKFLSAEKIDKA